ncbi:MAG: DNA repair protein RadC [Chromatiaceae bacterium]|nr:MAG: DNA repair protein RadC [Chromatiaceae bacterium]
MGRLALPHGQARVSPRRPRQMKQRSFPFADGRFEELALSEKEIVEKAIRCLEQRYLVSRKMLSSPREVEDFLRLHLTGLKYEVFACLFLDNRHRVITYQELFRGTIDGASVHPREVVREAMRFNAAAVIFAHNHPSGVAEPSQSDLRITARLKDALELVEVRVLDHFIIGEGIATSFAERGLL